MTGNMLIPLRPAITNYLEPSILSWKSWSTSEQLTAYFWSLFLCLLPKPSDFDKRIKQWRKGELFLIIYFVFPNLQSASWTTSFSLRLRKDWWISCRKQNWDDRELFQYIFFNPIDNVTSNISWSRGSYPTVCRQIFARVAPNENLFTFLLNWMFPGQVNLPSSEMPRSR